MLRWHTVAARPQAPCVLAQLHIPALLPTLNPCRRLRHCRARSCSGSSRGRASSASRTPTSTTTCGGTAGNAYSSTAGTCSSCTAGRWQRYDKQRLQRYHGTTSSSHSSTSGGRNQGPRHLSRQAWACLFLLYCRSEVTSRCCRCRHGQVALHHQHHRHHIIATATTITTATTACGRQQGPAMAPMQTSPLPLLASRRQQRHLCSAGGTCCHASAGALGTAVTTGHYHHQHRQQHRQQQWSQLSRRLQKQHLRSMWVEWKAGRSPSPCS